MHNLRSVGAALASLTDAGVQFLVMGGQAVVAYGAAEASRDLDICVAAPSESIPVLAE